MAKKRTIELTIAGYTFSLKNLKVHDDMSDETTCFSADLYCNNKKVAFCKNDGHGGSTDVYPYSEGLNYGLYVNAKEYLVRTRDTEYEKEMDEFANMHGYKNPEPWVQYWTPDHLCDQLMFKQSAWDDAVKQLKKIAKQHPKMNVFFNGDRVYVASKDTPIDDGFENVTEYVR